MSELAKLLQIKARPAVRLGLAAGRAADGSYVTDLGGVRRRSASLVRDLSPGRRVMTLAGPSGPIVIGDLGAAAYQVVESFDELG